MNILKGDHAFCRRVLSSVTLISMTALTANAHAESGRASTMLLSEEYRVEDLNWLNESGHRYIDSKGDYFAFSGDKNIAWIKNADNTPMGGKYKNASYTLGRGYVTVHSISRKLPGYTENIRLAIISNTELQDPSGNIYLCKACAHAPVDPTLSIVAKSYRAFDDFVDITSETELSTVDQSASRLAGYQDWTYTIEGQDLILVNKKADIRRFMKISPDRKKIYEKSSPAANPRSYRCLNCEPSSLQP